MDPKVNERIKAQHEHAEKEYTIFLNDLGDYLI